MANSDAYLNLEGLVSKEVLAYLAEIDTGAVGIAGVDSAVATFLATPTSANLLAALTTKTGTGSATFATAPTFTTSITLSDATVILGTSTGTKIGTATGQKLGFWNATPVVQQVFATGAEHTVDELITLLQTLGLCKQS